VARFARWVVPFRASSMRVAHRGAGAVMIG
jgi:hypothetical protein